MSWMITATGAEYHLTGPDSMTDAGRPVRIADIAHQLAIINRFHGATKRPYSVAEHSLLCSEIAQRVGLSLTVQLAALLHDGHEAYTNDLSSPAKAAVNLRSASSGGTHAWNVFETEHAKTVRAAFQLQTVFISHRAGLRHIDLVALATERRDLTLWNAETHAGWDVLGDNEESPDRRIPPLDYLRLDTPEREAVTWQDWRQVFRDRFDEILFGMSADRSAA